MTIAPELKYAMEAIHMLHMYGIIVSLGHTNASMHVKRGTGKWCNACYTFM